MTVSVYGYLFQFKFCISQIKITIASLFFENLKLILFPFNHRIMIHFIICLLYFRSAPVLRCKVHIRVVLYFILQLI